MFRFRPGDAARPPRHTRPLAPPRGTGSQAGAWRPRPALGDTPGAAPRPASRSVLVIEDDPFARAAMETILRARGYIVRGAAGGREGFAAARAAAPDVILIDLVMPGGDGWEVCRRVAADPALSAVAMVVISALGAEGGGVPERVAAYLRKPISAEELLAVVERCEGGSPNAQPQ